MDKIILSHADIKKGTEELDNPTYDFSTLTSLDIEEAKYSADEFRAEFSQKEDMYRIFVRLDEEESITDDVTHYFNVEKIIKECRRYVDSTNALAANIIRVLENKRNNE